MREARISGIPVIKDNMMVGIVTIEDVILALDNGYIEEPIERWYRLMICYGLSGSILPYSNRLRWSSKQRLRSCRIWPRRDSRAYRSKYSL
jgi:hypothetical protein